MKPFAVEDLVSSFNVDTISGVIEWTDTNRGKSQYEVYSSTNGGADVLLATTAAGATSYTDTGCKQNASVIYKVKTKDTDKEASASELATPLCLKTNQATLVTLTIAQLNIAVGKTVVVNYSDNTSQAYSGANSGITKTFTEPGQYNIWITGDINSIVSLNCSNQNAIYGDLTNWILPSSIAFLYINSTGVTGNWTNIALPDSISFFYINATSIVANISEWIIPGAIGQINLSSNPGITGVVPQITASAINGISLQMQGCSLSDAVTTVFRKAMTVFNISSQNVPFTTANIDKLLKALADWYEVNAPTANCTFNMSGANMGIPTGGSSNADITRLVGYYTAAGKTATVIVRTS